jgi:hypothetical protein
VKFHVLKAEHIVIAENNVLRGVISRGVAKMAGVSECCQDISTEWNGVTSQKTALFTVHRETRSFAITECGIMLQQPVSSRPIRQQWLWVTYKMGGVRGVSEN